MPFLLKIFISSAKCTNFGPFILLFWIKGILLLLSWKILSLLELLHIILLDNVYPPLNLFFNKGRLFLWFCIFILLNDNLFAFLSNSEFIVLNFVISLLGITFLIVFWDLLNKGFVTIDLSVYNDFSNSFKSLIVNSFLDIAFSKLRSNNNWFNSIYFFKALNVNFFIDLKLWNSFPYNFFQIFG